MKIRHRNGKDYGVITLTNGMIVVDGEIEINTDKDRIRFIKNQIKTLDSQPLQQLMTDEQYENEKKLISNELDKLEEKYGINNRETV